MAELEVVELRAEETHALRLTVLRNDTPTADVAFDVDELPDTFHLGVRDSEGLIAVSTWARRPYRGEAAVQLRGMATAPGKQGLGIGALLLHAGCDRAAAVAPVIWARARDSALSFYLRHGFAIDGDGFIDETTGKPHHVIVRRLT